ncbi:neuroligin-4 [Tropilaelaps mercedesae]|uniref:Neuroligin-4 n=1 Tax=Tropilaelaps mercedesae TaxID=418985 RepID=A0A1V9X7B2_9ACAR|nr:neuroligin-4 [Tropilaelaps mercedesae]
MWVWATRTILGFFLMCGWFAAATTVGASRLSSRTVTTRYGALKGNIVTLEQASRAGLQPVEVFLGVPYASPPTNNMRFMPPGTPTQWKGIRMADRFAPVCPQRPPDIRNETEALKKLPRGRLEYLRRLLPFLHKQSEDCLYLNIYSPAIAKSLEFEVRYQVCHARLQSRQSNNIGKCDVVRFASIIAGELDTTPSPAGL